jgi:RNA polymerase sigma-70 factor (ECF subfamily)
MVRLARRKHLIDTVGSGDCDPGRNRYPFQHAAQCTIARAAGQLDEGRSVCGSFRGMNVPEDVGTAGSYALQRTSIIGGIGPLLVERYADGEVAMGDQTMLLERLLARMLKGDAAARRDLINHAYERLRCLAAVVLNQSFPRLKRAPALVDTTDLTNDVAIKLYEALAEVQPATVPEFFRLAAQRMRWLLLDLARRVDRADDPPSDIADPQRDTDTPASSVSATLAALYAQIEALPEKEREVVDLLYFHGLTQPETAALLGVAERTVRRYWTIAKIKLFEGLQPFLPSTAPVPGN